MLTASQQQPNAGGYERRWIMISGQFEGSISTVSVNSVPVNSVPGMQRFLNPLWQHWVVHFQPAISLWTRSPVVLALYLRIKRAR